MKKSISPARQSRSSADDPVIIQEYDKSWPRQFETLRSRIAIALSEMAAAIEHVGSTAVPGLAAKPIIDLDVLLFSAGDLPSVIARLASLGYEHRGDLGIAGREAFRAPLNDFRHHLYVCLPAGKEYRRHIAFRDYLRTHPREARAYASLKRDLARQFRDDREAYNQAKSRFVTEILQRSLGPEHHPGARIPVMTDLAFNIGSNFSRYYQSLAEKIHALLEPLSDDQIWTRPYPYGNSVGHLLLHLAGNLNFYIGAHIATTGYIRNRDLEFTSQDRISKENLLQAFAATMVMVQDAIAKQSSADWSAAYSAKGMEDAGNRFTVFLRCAAHLDHHLGQMIYLRKEMERQSAHGAAS